MLRYFMIVVLSVLGIISAGRLVEQAGAEPLGVHIRPQNEHRPDVSTPEGGSINVPEGELRRRLEAELAKVIEQVPQWPCLKAVDPNRLSNQPITAVQIEYDISRTTTLDLQRGRVEAWEVRLWTMASGRKAGSRVRNEAYIFDTRFLNGEERRSPEVGEEFVQQVIERATTLLRQAISESLAGEVNPCEITTTLNGRATLDLGDIKVTYTYDAESILKLTADGSFDAAGPLSIGIDVRVSSDCQTSVTGRFVEPKLRAVGAYHADDGTLAFKSLNVSAAALTAEGSVVCPGGGSATCSLDSRVSATLQCTNATSLPFPFKVDGDMLEGQELRVALRDGERRAIPRSAGLIPEMTFDLTLGIGYRADGGSAVAAATTPAVSGSVSR